MSEHVDACECEVRRGEISRRAMIGAAGAVGLTAAAGGLTQLAFADGASGDVVVVIFARGGLDGLSAVVPYDDASYHKARPALGVPAGQVVKLTDRFGLHPALGPLRDAWRRGHLAVVHAVGSPANSRSHFDAQEWIERGTPGSKSISSGWLGRHLQTRPGRSTFRAVSLGWALDTMLHGSVPAVQMRSVGDFSLLAPAERRPAVQHTLEQLYHQLSHPLARQSDTAVEALRRLAKVAATPYVPRPGVVYPKSDLGSRVSELSRLLKAGLGLEAASLTAHSWDLHQGAGTWSSGAQTSLLADLGQSLGAFYRDLGPLLSRVTVVVMSEFGRRVEENGSGGTDHGNGGVMFVLGGGIRGGRIYGSWPGLAPSQRDDGDLRVTTDYRDVLSEVLRVRAGNGNLGAVFPDHAYRPLGLAHPR